MKHQTFLWKKIFFLYGTLIVVVFSVVFISLFAVLSSAVESERHNIMQQQLQLCSATLDPNIEDIMQTHTQFLGNPTFARYLQDGAVIDGDEDTSPLDRQLSATREGSWLINTILLYDRDFQLVGSSLSHPAGESYYSWLTDYVSSFASTLGFRAFFTVEGRLFYIGSIYAEDNYAYNGYLVFELFFDRFFYAFLSDSAQDFAYTFITDGENLVLSSDRELSQLPFAPEGSQEAELAGNTYSVFSCTNSAYSNWKIYTLLSPQSFWDVLMEQFTIVCMLLLLSLLATLIVSFLIAKKITKPLGQLSESFGHLKQGQYPPPLTVTSRDEIGQLINGYNHVVKSLQQLTENLVAQQAEKQKYEVAAIKTRLDLLQSQIQPHFIHNTLNGLNCMAMEAGNTELSQTITSFNALLRASISTESDFYTVESEIACIRHYMRIQSMRYGDREVQCQMDVDEEAKAALLPRLVLQPLVENSLYHGILPCDDRAGLILVTCKTDGTTLFVSIRDNGVGINPEKLEKIQTGEGVSPSGYNHIGIKNVKERLQLLYQQDCHFQISSQANTGTTISFQVPYRRY